jgi:uncharacterized protein
LNRKNNTANPSSVGDRIDMIDALRGFALAGVCFANLPFFSGFSLMDSELQSQLPCAKTDTVIIILNFFFVHLKFWTIFTMLFGFGFAIILKRAKHKGVDGRKIYFRRLIILLLLGLGHRYLLWWGDFLSLYALLGFFLFFFYNTKQKLLVYWGILIGIFGNIIYYYFDPDFGIDTAAFTNRLFQNLKDGTYRDVVSLNIATSWGFFKYFIGDSLHSFGGFLFGYWAGKTGLFSDMQNQYSYIKKLQRFTLWIGILLSGPFTLTFILFTYNLIAVDSKIHLIRHLGMAAAYCLAIGYATTFALLYENKKWEKRLSIFREMGRMALTNYLLQSFINVFVFYGIGLNLFGRFGYLPLILWFFNLTAIQIYFSKWWLSNYRFGPMEWLWRSLTYGKWQPMKIRTEKTAIKILY